MNTTTIAPAIDQFIAILECIAKDTKNWRPFMLHTEMRIRASAALEKRFMHGAEARRGIGFDVMKAAALKKYADDKKTMPYFMDKQNASKYLGFTSDDYDLVYLASVMRLEKLSKPDDEITKQVRIRILNALNLHEK